MLGTGLLGIDSVASSTMGFIVGAIINFLLAHHFAFASLAPIWSTAWRFALVATIGLALNAAVVYLHATVLGFHYLLSQLPATVAVLIWNIAGNKWWSFR